MQDRTIDEAEFEAGHLKKLLDQACGEIAHWKVKAEGLEKEIKELKKEIVELKRRGGVVRLPLGTL